MGKLYARYVGIYTGWGGRERYTTMKRQGGVNKSRRVCRYCIVQEIEAYIREWYA